MRRLKVARELPAQLSKPQAAPRNAAAEARQRAAWVQILKQRAFPREQIRPEAGVQARVPMAQQAVARQQEQLALQREAQQLWAWPQPEALVQDVPVVRRLLPSFA